MTHVDHAASLTNIRHHLHSIAEVAWKEERTAAYVASQLRCLSPDTLVTGVGQRGHALVASFRVCPTEPDAGPGSGKHVLLRAELDALPVHEVNPELPHRSTNEGWMHACGHDVHMTILLGVAQALARGWSPSSGGVGGRVTLVFQSAEENGCGARDCVSSPAWKSLTSAAAPTPADPVSASQPWLGPVHETYALHNLPGHDTGTVVTRKGTFSSCVVSVVVTFTGLTSHAAEPHNGCNPACAVADLTHMVTSWSWPSTEGAAMPGDDASATASNAVPALHERFPHYALITVVHMVVGERGAFGVNPGHGELHLTMRTWHSAHMDALLQHLERATRVVQQQHGDGGLRVAVEQAERFEATMNATSAVDHIVAAAQHLNLPVYEPPIPMAWGEDYGVFTQEVACGAMFGLGVGKESPALHHCDYDGNDEVIDTGVNMFLQILERSFV